MQAYQNRESQKNQQNITLEKQIVVLVEQHDNLQKRLSMAEDKVVLLRQEKLFLAQEKSELQGYLKQTEHKRPLTEKIE